MTSESKRLQIKKHLLIFFLTLIVFGSGFVLSDYLTSKRISQLTKLQENLRIDILSMETRFSILSQAPCNIVKESFLVEELSKIAQRLNSLGARLGENNPEFLMLKKYYSVLQIKHWLLLKQASERCTLDLVPIVYFYENEKSCKKCRDQSYVLTYLVKKYPFLRVYAFDYDMPLSAVQAMRLIFGVKKELPAVVINEKVYYGFHSLEELEEILNLKKPSLQQATTTTSTTTTNSQ